MGFPDALNLFHQRSSAGQGATLRVGREPPEAAQLHLGLFLPEISRYSLAQGFFLKEISSYTHRRERGKEGKREITELLGSRLQLRGVEQNRALPRCLVTDGAVGAAHLLGYNPH